MQIKYRTNRINYDHDRSCKGVADMIEVFYQIDSGETKKFALDSELIFEDRIHLSILYDVFKRYDFEFDHVIKPVGEWDATMTIPPVFAEHLTT